MSPTSAQSRRRRVTALIVLAALATVAVYLAVTATVFAPLNEHGARVVHLDVHTQAVGRELGVNVVVPAKTRPPGERPLLVFLHGRSGSDRTFTGDEAVSEGLSKLRRNAPIVAFPEGGVATRQPSGSQVAKPLPAPSTIPPTSPASMSSAW